MGLWKGEGSWDCQEPSQPAHPIDPSRRPFPPVTPPLFAAAASSRLRLAAPLPLTVVDSLVFPCARWFVRRFPTRVVWMRPRPDWVTTLPHVSTAILRRSPKKCCVYSPIACCTQSMAIFWCVVVGGWGSCLPQAATAGVWLPDSLCAPNVHSLHTACVRLACRGGGEGAWLEMLVCGVRWVAVFGRLGCADCPPLRPPMLVPPFAAHGHMRVYPCARALQALFDIATKLHKAVGGILAKAARQLAQRRNPPAPKARRLSSAPPLPTHPPTLPLPHTLVRAVSAIPPPRARAPILVHMGFL